MPAGGSEWGATYTMQREVLSLINAEKDAYLSAVRAVNASGWPDYPVATVRPGAFPAYVGEGSSLYAAGLGTVSLCPLPTYLLQAGDAQQHLLQGGFVAARRSTVAAQERRDLHGRCRAGVDGGDDLVGAGLRDRHVGYFVEFAKVAQAGLLAADMRWWLEQLESPTTRRALLERHGNPGLARALTWSGTFHAIGARMLREYAPRAQLVFDTIDLHYLREQRAALGGLLVAGPLGDPGVEHERAARLVAGVGQIGQGARVALSGTREAALQADPVETVMPARSSSWRHTVRCCTHAKQACMA